MTPLCSRYQIPCSRLCSGSCWCTSRKVGQMSVITIKSGIRQSHKCCSLPPTCVPPKSTSLECVYIPCNISICFVCTYVYTYIWSIVHLCTYTILSTCTCVLALPQENNFSHYKEYCKNLPSWVMMCMCVCLLCQCKDHVISEIMWSVCTELSACWIRCSWTIYILYLSLQKPGHLFPINNYSPGVYMSPFQILYRRLFTLEHWTPAFIWAQVFIWALLLFG